MIEEVTFVCVASAFSGGERYFVSLAEATARRCVVTVAGTAGSRLLDEARTRGLPTRTVDLGRKLGRRTAVMDVLGWPLYARRLDALVDQCAARGGLVLQYKWEEILWGGRRHAGRVALLEHGAIPADVTRVPYVRSRLRRAFRSARTVLATSEPATRSIAAFSGRRPARIPTGVDAGRAERAVARREELQAELLGANGGLLLASAGRVEENKGVLDLVRLLTFLPDAVLVVAGIGEAGARLGALAEELGVADRIRRLGFVADVMPVLAAADAVMLLTRDPGEGKPLVALEAGAVGTPVVGAAGSLALRALAAEEGAGIVHLVDEADLDAVADAVRRVTSSPRPSPVRPSWDDAADVLLSGLRGDPGG